MKIETISRRRGRKRETRGGETVPCFIFVFSCRSLFLFSPCFLPGRPTSLLNALDASTIERRGRAPHASTYDLSRFAAGLISGTKVERSIYPGTGTRSRDAHMIAGQLANTHSQRRNAAPVVQAIGGGACSLRSIRAAIRRCCSAINVDRSFCMTRARHIAPINSRARARQLLLRSASVNSIRPSSLRIECRSFGRVRFTGTAARYDGFLSLSLRLARSSSRGGGGEKGGFIFPRQFAASTKSILASACCAPIRFAQADPPR